MLTDVLRPQQRAGRKLTTLVLFSNSTNVVGIEHASVCKRQPACIISLGLHNSPAMGGYIVLHFTNKKLRHKEIEGLLRVV